MQEPDGNPQGKPEGRTVNGNLSYPAASGKVSVCRKHPCQMTSGLWMIRRNRLYACHLWVTYPQNSVLARESAPLFPQTDT